MRLLSYLPKFACTFGLIALGGLASIGAVSAEELVGTPVPIEAGAELGLPEVEQPQLGISNMPPPAAVMAEQEHALKETEAAMREVEQVMQEQRNWHRELDHGMHKAFADDEIFNSGVLIPMLAILFLFGGPILILILMLIFFFGAKRRRQRDINMNIDKLLAAGRDIPVELLRGDEPLSADAGSNLNQGIKNICVGTGLLIFLTIFMGIKVGSVAFILIGLGVSRVLVWKLEQTNKPTSVQAQD